MITIITDDMDAIISYEEFCKIMDNSNFMIDSNNPYDMRILAILKKHVPKKPIIFLSDQYDYPETAYKCSVCQSEELLYKEQLYCDVCGQAVDWSVQKICTYDENYFKPCEIQAIDCEDCEWNDVVE